MESLAEQDQKADYQKETVGTRLNRRIEELEEQLNALYQVRKGMSPEVLAMPAYHLIRFF